MSESHLFCNFALSHVPHGGRTLKCEGVSIGNASHLKNHKMLILSLSKIRYIVQVGPQIVKTLIIGIIKDLNQRFIFVKPPKKRLKKTSNVPIFAENCTIQMNMTCA